MSKQSQSLLYYLLYGSYYIISLLPLRILYIISDFVYFLTYYVVRYRREIVRNNLTNSFPEKDIKTIITIEKEFYSRLCDYFLESIKLMSMSKKQMLKRMKFEGMEPVNELFKNGRSIAFYLAHTFNWEWITSFPMHVKTSNENVVFGQIYHRLANKAFDRLFLRLRERFGTVSIAMPDTARVMMTYRKEKRPAIIGFIADQAPKWHMIDHWITFLNQETAVITGTERIIKKLNYAAIFSTLTRVKRGYYVCKIVRLVEDTSQMPDYELTDIYYQHLEESIRQNPAAWLWSHKRWKRTKEMFERMRREHEAAKNKQSKNVEKTEE